MVEAQEKQILLETSKLTKGVLTSLALSFDCLYLIWGWTTRGTRQKRDVVELVWKGRKEVSLWHPWVYTDHFPLAAMAFGLGVS